MFENTNFAGFISQEKKKHLYSRHLLFQAKNDKETKYKQTRDQSGGKHREKRSVTTC